MNHPRRPFFIALLLITLALVLSSPVNLAFTVEPRAQDGRKGTVVFAVFGDATQPRAATMEPILVIDGGSYKAPVAGDSDAAEITRFSNAYYRKGDTYRLLAGGGAAGTVAVKKSGKDNECFRTGADVELQTAVRLNKNVMALATDSKTLGQAVKSSRRAPTAAERAAAIELARTAFTKEGVPASVLSTLETINLTAMDLDRDGRFEMVGSFVVSKRQKPQWRRWLFLVAEPEGKSYRAALTTSEQLTEDAIMSGANINIVNDGIYVQRLVDQLDLDGDGKAEIVTTSTGLEGVGYTIYKRRANSWQAVYDFSNYRCAF